MSGRPRPAPAGGTPARRRQPVPAAAKPGAAAAEVQQQALVQNPLHFAHNMGVAYFLRIFMTIVAGSAVGVLGVEGWAGFGAYLASQAACTLPILAKCGGNYRRFFPSWDKVVLEHVFSSTAILSYILFWMLFYNICHVF